MAHRCVLQCVAASCSVLQCVAVCSRVSQCAAACCSVLQYVAVCCSVVQCVATWCSVAQFVHRQREKETDRAKIWTEQETKEERYRVAKTHRMP